MKRRTFIKNSTFTAAVIAAPILLTGIARAEEYYMLTECEWVPGHVRECNESIHTNADGSKKTLFNCTPLCNSEATYARCAKDANGVLQIVDCTYQDGEDF